MQISKKEARRRIAAVNLALRAGHPPPGTAGNNRTRGAIRAAAQKLGIDPQTLRDQLSVIACVHELAPDWTLYKPPVKAAPPPVAKPEEPPAEPLVVRRLADQLAQERAGRRDAERAAISAEGLREGVFKLAATPPIPENWVASAPEKDGKRREVIVLPISDVHMGEVIDIDQMGGRNAYNRTIAARRLERLFQSVVKLGTIHWSGPPPRRSMWCCSAISSPARSTRSWRKPTTCFQFPPCASCRAI